MSKIKDLIWEFEQGYITPYKLVEKLKEMEGCEEPKSTKIDTAKKYLESEGYFTANLWHTDDVCQNYRVNQDQALDIIEDAMTSEITISRIFEAIDIIAEENGYENKNEDR